MGLIDFDVIKLKLNGVHGIEASAGTGKTYAIALLYVRYLLEFESKVDQLLVVTFTEAATAELRERIRSRLKDALDYLELQDHLIDEPLMACLKKAGIESESQRQRVKIRLRQAIGHFHRAAIYTIHGFCQRALGEFVFETGSQVDAELITNQHDLVDEIYTDFVSMYWTGHGEHLNDHLPLSEQAASLRGVISNAINHEYAVLQPVSNASVWACLHEPADALWTTAINDFSTLWLEQRDELYRVFLTAMKEKRLNGKRCTIKRVDAAFAFMDQLTETRSMFTWVFDDDHQITDIAQTFLGQSNVRALANKNKAAVEHEILERVEVLVGLANELGDPRVELLLRLNTHAVHFARESIQRKREEKAFMTFNDMLQQLDYALNDPGKGQVLIRALQQKYKVALVDEFQDTDPTQFRIFSRVFQTVNDQREPRAFIMIGDPKQSIYGFRGADLRSYRAAMAQVPDGQLYKMTKNWRSDRSLIHALNTIYEKANDPFESVAVPYFTVDHEHEDRMAGPPIQMRMVRRLPVDVGNKKAPSKERAMRQVLKQLTLDIQAYLVDGHMIETSEGPRQVTPSDLAVLCYRNQDLLEIQQHLVELGLPAVLYSTFSIFETQEALYVRQWLHAVLRPKDLSAVMTVLQNPIAGFSVSQLQIEQDLSLITHWMRLFQAWHQLLIHQGVIAAWQACSRYWRVGQRLGGIVSGERVITNLEQVVEILHAQSRQDHMKVDSLLSWLDRMINDPSQRDEDDAKQLRLETDDAAITLCSIHRSKGLEYPIVFCPTLWVGFDANAEKGMPGSLVVSDEPLDPPVLDIGSEKFEARWVDQFTQKQIEKHRLLYVALTRAKHQLIIHMTAARQAKASALCHLLGVDLDQGGDDETLYAQVEKQINEYNTSDEYVVLTLVDSKDILSSPKKARRVDSSTLVCAEVTREHLGFLGQTSFSGIKSRRRLEDELSHPRDVEDDVINDNLMYRSTNNETLAQHVPMADVPGGPALGDLIHKVMEQLLLSGMSTEAVEDEIKTALAHQADRLHFQELNQGAIVKSMHTTLVHPLHELKPGFQFCQLQAGQMRVELSFLLPVSTRGLGVNAAGLAACFQVSSSEVLKRYADRLSRIDMHRFRGYMEGYIDLVFELDGQWWITDWKSNRMGETYADYSDEAMQAVMVSHDYLLQAYLYGVALHRILQLRLPDYKITQHLKGYMYVFMRGVKDHEAISTGIYQRSYDVDVILALSVWLEGEGGRGEH